VTPQSPDALDRLTLALDGLARGLERGTPDAVLAAEEPLADATAALRAADLTQLARRPDIRFAMLQVRLAMSRCRTLGATAQDLAAVISPGDYGPSGLQRRPRAVARTMGTRT
jgi:hypothetical protein